MWEIAHRTFNCLQRLRLYFRSIIPLSITRSIVSLDSAVILFLIVSLRCYKWLYLKLRKINYCTSSWLLKTRIFVNQQLLIWALPSMNISISTGCFNWYCTCLKKKKYIKDTKLLVLYKISWLCVKFIVGLQWYSNPQLTSP